LVLPVFAATLPPMKRLIFLTAMCCSLFAAVAKAGPAEADGVKAALKSAMEKWALEVRAAVTPEARTKALGAKPDPALYGRKMWAVIAPALGEEWVLDPAAWFVGLVGNLRTPLPDGSNSLTFAKELASVQAAVETYHMKSAKLAPVCLALSASEDPRALALLEKIQAGHTVKSVQGVAALAIAMRLKTLGDDPGLMSKRLTLLRKAIIDSAEVAVNGTTVAKLAADELYIINHLTKGREAPDLVGTDSGMRPLKLSDFKGKVLVLLFWNSAMDEAARVLEMTTALEGKFAGKPFALIGINNDPVENLREMQKQPDLVTFPNFSDPQNRLANEYRIGSWPLVYVLDGERKIHYAGPPGSFVELTAAALLDPAKPAPKK
jgi:peroxiredoxin